MSENFNSHIACEGTDNDINWVCKVCKDLPNYAGMYLYQREREKNQLKNVKDRRADLILLKYYYALLHLLHDEFKRGEQIREIRDCASKVMIKPEDDNTYGFYFPVISEKYHKELLYYYGLDDTLNFEVEKEIFVECEKYLHDKINVKELISIMPQKPARRSTAVSVSLEADRLSWSLIRMLYL